MAVTQTEETIELVCNTNALPTEDREAQLTTAQRLMVEAYQEIKELPDGYAFKFAAEEFESIIQYINIERLCCAFFSFDLKIAPNHGSLWLHIYGNQQIKAFLRTELQANGNKNVA